MSQTRKWHSIRWRIVLIYFLLVFIVMAVVGVFILGQLRDYQMASVRSNFTKIVQENILSGMAYEDLSANRESLQADTEAWAQSLREELFVVDGDFRILASSNRNFVDRNALDVLEQGVLLRGFAGEIAEEDSVLSSGIPVKTIAFPIRSGGETVGLFCLRADISNVYDTLENALNIIVRALLLALLLTTVLSAVIARSITEPINSVTETAESMAGGDFSQELHIQSDDEIGRLAQMFNLLRGELDKTISDINNEKSKLKTILENMVDGLVAIDPDGRIIHANPALRRMLALEPEEPENASYQELIGCLDPVLSYEVLQEGCANGGGQEILEKDGSIFAVRYDRFRDEAGRDAGIILLLEDITERQKLAKMQKDFVANVSHELKTPLTTIKSYTETLLDGAVEDKETALHFLGIVDSEADRMNRLVKDLLQLSRLDHQQEQLHMTDCNLSLLLKNTVMKMEVLAKAKEQHMICIFDEQRRLYALIDKDRIEQVLINVLSNAVKYTQEGGRIDVDLYPQGKEAKILVIDNGIGIDAEELPRVFERFYRVDKARSREMGGTGLGLAIAKHIVEEHKGSIEMESQKGKGTKVIITLPLAPDRAVPGIE